MYTITHFDEHYEGKIWCVRRETGGGGSSQGEFSEKASPRKRKELDMKPKCGWTSELFLVQCTFAYLH